MCVKPSMKINSLTGNLFPNKIMDFTELPNLKCVMCGIPLLKKSEVDSFIRRVCRQNASMPSEKSISSYLDTMYYQKGCRTDLLPIMESYAKKYPDKSFGEIFAMPEVLEPHLKISHEYFAKSFEKNRPLFELMEEKINASPKLKEKLAELHKKAVNISIGNHSDFVKRYLILKLYSELENEIGVIRTSKLLEYAKQIPLMSGSPDLALCHMAGKSDAHIMQGFLSSVTPMKKRIVPTDGHGVFVCQPCATEAGYVPFSSLFTLFPKMFSNIQEQLNQIISALAGGHLQGHGDYPKVLQRLVAAATDGKRILNLSNYNYRKGEIVRKASVPLTAKDIKAKKQKKLERLKNVLMRETPDTVKKYIKLAQQHQEELVMREGVSAQQLKAQSDYIAFLKKVYILVLKRDKLI